MNLITLEWTATIVMIIGAFVNSAEISYHNILLGPLLLIAGGVVWLRVAIIWKETPLIITNAVMIVVGLLGIIYKYLG